jgi:mannose-6-phosphate isomerase-like protein (cupin superfamily)
MTKAVVIQNDAALEIYTMERCFIIEWWNSPDDEHVSVARAKVIPGVTTRRHLLKGVTERYIILEGKGCVEVGHLAPKTVGPGDVVIIPPGIPQRITNTGESDLIFLAVCTPRFKKDIYEDIDPEGISTE